MGNRLEVEPCIIWGDMASNIRLAVSAILVDGHVHESTQLHYC